MQIQEDETIMDSLEQYLEKYAEVAVKVGVNIQPGQTLLIRSDIEVAPFVRKVVKAAYEKGAKHVYVDWSDTEVTKLKFKLAPEEAFAEFPEWLANKMNDLAEENAAFMSIVSNDPDALRGVDTNRIATQQKVAGEALKKYYDYIQADKVSWTVIAAASKGWADKVFPDKPESERVNLLWEEIFRACRIYEDDPVQAWKEHDEKLRKLADYLTEKQYTALHYRAPGTDLTIGLPKNHLWVGGGSVNEQGTSFMANIPTEEVFTAPDRNRVNGYVTSTKPLSYGGNIIDNFTVTFENGRIVDIQAEKGADILQKLIESDEGARYLGEVALVPHNSPISRSNVLFLNTLFDENASNHIAIGSAYAFNLKGGKEMDRDELLEHGINNSIVHVDFMIGSQEMDIDGITADGKKEPVFRNGNWAFTL